MLLGVAGALDALHLAGRGAADRLGPSRSVTGFAPIWWPFGQGLPFVPQSETVAKIAGSAHWWFSKLMIAAILLHVAGALKHHLIDAMTRCAA